MGKNMKFIAKFIVAHTFRLLLREKILFNIFGVTLLLLFFGYLAALLVYGSQDRVMLDLGLTMNALSIFTVAVGMGARLFRNEIESKTIYLYLTRPISRSSFFLGRFFGMSAFLVLNFAILVAILALAVHWMQGSLSAAFFHSAVLTVFEALILLAAALMLSFWMRPALVFMVCFALVFLGHNHEMLQSLQSNPETRSWLFGLLGGMVPNFGFFLMSDRVYYEEALSRGDFALGLLYGLVWLLFFLLIGNAVFSRKNL